MNHPVEAPPRKAFVPNRAVVPSGVLAMGIFVFSELMFFAGLISAFVIVRSQEPDAPWPPPGQPRLAVWETGINTAF